MLDVLTRAGCFIAIIIGGYVLRKVNFFKEGDFAVLSKITLKITLPAAFISNFSGKFTIPFVQSFLGPVGVITTSLFDAGNAYAGCRL